MNGEWNGVVVSANCWGKCWEVLCPGLVFTAAKM